MPPPGNRTKPFCNPGRVTKENALARIGDFAEGWSEAQLDYAWWLATGTRKRQPKTIAEYARGVENGESTLRSWNKQPAFSDLVVVLTKASLALRWPDIVDAVAEDAEAGNLEAAKFCGRYLGEYADQGLRVSGDAKRPVLFKIVTPQLPAGETVEGEVVESG